MTDAQLAQLERIGNRWQKNGKDRLYFNDLPRLYGLCTNHYHTGNISSATLDGETISNSEARRIVGRLNLAKLWYDYSDGQFHSRDLDEADEARLIGRLTIPEEGSACSA